MFLRLLLATVSLSSFARADSGPCGAEPAAIIGTLDFDNHPFSTVAESSDRTDACKRVLLERLAYTADRRAEAGTCMSSGCPELRSSLSALRTAIGTNETACTDVSSYLEPARRADAAAARVADEDIAIIRTKLADGVVPDCQIPAGCPGSGCRASLERKWWTEEDVTYESRDAKERWIRTGSFAYLLLADAFTCELGSQDGGTCTIYSGVSVMTHYCVSAQYNPSAEVSSSQQGPGFRCPRASEVLQDSHSDGHWNVTKCSEDEDAGRSTCIAAPSNPEQKAEQDALAAYSKDCPFGPRSAECRKLLAKIEALRLKAGKASGGTWLSGKVGLSLPDFAKTARRYGFNSSPLNSDSNGWNDGMKAVNGHHPIQITLDAKGWNRYDAKEATPHALVVEGHWSGDDGIERVLLRDSNFPDSLKLFQVDDVKPRYTQFNGGGLILCPPTDNALCPSSI